MRVFWAVIGLLVIGAAGLVWSKRAGSAQEAEAPVAAAVQEAAPRAEVGRESAFAARRAGDGGAAAKPAEAVEPAEEAVTELAAETPASRAEEVEEPITTSVYVLEAPPGMAEEHRAALEEELAKARNAERPDLTRKLPEVLDLPGAKRPEAIADGSEEEEDGAAAAGVVTTGPAGVETESGVAEEVREEAIAANDVMGRDDGFEEAGDVGAAAGEGDSGLAGGEAEAVVADAEAEDRAGETADGAGDAPAAATGIVRREDGAMVVEDRFVVRGAGTKEDPYRVSWSLLVSASESYNPRLGKTELAEHITMLNEKYVRISGFVAFPFMVADVQEMLMMQNQWDGCCIGVPPTAYDAIEVTLGAPATDAERFLQYGAVLGRLKVEPYARNKWLISLYTMDDATLVPEM